ncbi:methyltransferase domain-containing protein [Nonomuraea sp. NPDC049269]|uniref:methyltransferase domain-containing protein n=1 Tax=Nonomuraea sp. NPDC049269 TaxID=3364349 RepID=UPI0037216865
MRCLIQRPSRRQVYILAAAAEAVPLPTSSVYAVTAGQSLHWFRGRQAQAEIHSTLRPQGSLALVWNVRDDLAEWIRELNSLIDRHAGNAPRYANSTWPSAFRRAPFEPLRHEQFRHVQREYLDGLLGRVA